MMTAMALFVALASIFLFPWLAGTTFGPRHEKGEVDFTALRNNAHLAARNDNKQLRDADRDDGKGGTPPDNNPHILAAIAFPNPIERPENAPRLSSSREPRFFYRGGLQPRAPPSASLLIFPIA